MQVQLLCYQHDATVSQHLAHCAAAASQESQLQDAVCSGTCALLLSAQQGSHLGLQLQLDVVPLLHEAGQGVPKARGASPGPGTAGQDGR